MKNALSLLWFAIKLMVFMTLAQASKEVTIVAYQQF